MDLVPEKVFLILSDEEDEPPLIFRDIALALDIARSLMYFGATAEVYECVLIKTYRVGQQKEEA